MKNGSTTKPRPAKARQKFIKEGQSLAAQKSHEAKNLQAQADKAQAEAKNLSEAVKNQKIKGHKLEMKAAEIRSNMKKSIAVGPSAKHFQGKEASYVAANDNTTVATTIPDSTGRLEDSNIPHVDDLLDLLDEGKKESKIKPSVVIGTILILVALYLIYRKYFA